MRLRERALGHQKGSLNTVGVGVPRSNEGSPGDLAVRRVSNGVRLYVKVGNVWYDANVSLNPTKSLYTPSASSDIITKKYMDTDGTTFMMSANAFVRIVNGANWFICNNSEFHDLGDDETTVGNTVSITTAKETFQCVMAIIPFNMNVTAVSCGVTDEDMDAGSNTTDKRMGLFRKTGFSRSGLDPTTYGGSVALELMWITNAFDGVANKWASCYDKAANFNLDAGDIIFSAYLNPDGGTNSEVTTTMNVWAKKR